jgi:hypothetical protein
MYISDSPTSILMLLQSFNYVNIDNSSIVDDLTQLCCPSYKPVTPTSDVLGQAHMALWHSLMPVDLHKEEAWYWEACYCNYL